MMSDAKWVWVIIELNFIEKSQITLIFMFQNEKIYEEKQMRTQEKISGGFKVGGPAS